MEQIFSSNSEDIFRKHIDSSSQDRLSLNTIESLDQYFDIEKIVSWVKDKHYKRVSFTASNILQSFNY